MKRGLILILLVTCFGVSIVTSQTPSVQVFFEYNGGNYSGMHLDQCPPDPPGTVIDSFYVIANNFNMWISAIEYSIDFPQQLLFIAQHSGGLDIGTVITGIATAWPFPINGFEQVCVNKVTFLYMCHACNEIYIPIIVKTHPTTGFIRAVRWPDNIFVNGIGMISFICSVWPVEETTWGKVKALYQ